MNKAILSFLAVLSANMALSAMEAPQEVEIKKVFPAIGALHVKITSKGKVSKQGNPEQVDFYSLLGTVTREEDQEAISKELKTRAIVSREGIKLTKAEHDLLLKAPASILESVAIFAGAQKIGPNWPPKAQKEPFRFSGWDHFGGIAYNNKNS